MLVINISGCGKKSANRNNVDPERKAAIESANNSLNKKDYGAAINTLETYCQTHPNDTVAKKKLAHAYAGAAGFDALETSKTLKNILAVVKASSESKNESDNSLDKLAEIIENMPELDNEARINLNKSLAIYESMKEGNGEVDVDLEKEFDFIAQDDFSIEENDEESKNSDKDKSVKKTATKDQSNKKNAAVKSTSDKSTVNTDKVSKIGKELNFEAGTIYLYRMLINMKILVKVAKKELEFTKDNEREIIVALKNVGLDFFYVYTKFKKSFKKIKDFTSKVDQLLSGIAQVPNKKLIINDQINDAKSFYLTMLKGNIRILAGTYVERLFNKLELAKLLGVKSKIDSLLDEMPNGESDENLNAKEAIVKSLNGKVFIKLFVEKLLIAIMPTNDAATRKAARHDIAVVLPTIVAEALGDALERVFIEESLDSIRKVFDKNLLVTDKIIEIIDVLKDGKIDKDELNGIDQKSADYLKQSSKKYNQEVKELMVQNDSIKETFKQAEKLKRKIDEYKKEKNVDDENANGNNEIDNNDSTDEGQQPESKHEVPQEESQDE